MKKMVGKRTGRQEGMGTEEKQEQKGARERGKDQSVNQSFLSFSSLREVNCFFALEKYPRSFNPLHAMFFFFLFNIYHPSKILTFSEFIISKPYTTTTNQHPNTTTKVNKQAKKHHESKQTTKLPNKQTTQTSAYHRACISLHNGSSSAILRLAIVDREKERKRRIS